MPPDGSWNVNYSICLYSNTNYLNEHTYIVAVPYELARHRVQSVRKEKRVKVVQGL